MKKISLILPLLAMDATSLIYASDLPSVNLGLTSFLDGGLPAGGGWYFQFYAVDYSANHINDSDGRKIALPDSTVHFQALANQLLYVSDVRLGNATLGFNVILPIVSKMDVGDGLQNQVLKDQGGMGDVMAGPFLQFDPMMGSNGPKFVQRIEFDVIAPTGDYNRNRDINPGNNAWSFNPYWAATYFLIPKWTVSTRVHYLYNFSNNDPVYSFTDASRVQAGQAVHANFASEYALTDHFRLGVNGYWLKQFTDTKIDGRSVSGRREKVWAVGPGAMYSLSENDHFFVNSYFEQNVKNRPDGTRLVFRHTHHF